MDKEIFRVSILRIVNSKVKLTEKEKKIAFDKYKKNLFDYAIDVKYENHMYHITGGDEIYLLCKENHADKINIRVEYGVVDKIISDITNKIKKEILNPMLCAILYEELMNLNNLSQKDIANIIQKSQGAISNKMRLLKLPINVKNEIIKKTIKERHGRAILQLYGRKNFKEESKLVLEKIISENMKVSETEDYIYSILEKKIGVRDTLNIKKIDGRNELKHPSIGIVIDKVDSELAKTMKVLDGFFPNLEIRLDQGIDRDDYVFLLKLKGINK